MELNLLEPGRELTAEEDGSLLECLGEDLARLSAALKAKPG
jgi:hypothetical protein